MAPAHLPSSCPLPDGIDTVDLRGHWDHPGLMLGLKPMQVLVASTRGGALAMGRDKEIGTVEKGKLADLLIVAADPTADVANLRKVRWVIRGGVMRPIEELSALAK